MSNAANGLSTPAIAPSILTADFGRLRSQIEEAEAAGVDLIHLDVMDGHFVPNISFGPLIVAAVRESTSLPVDVHLMIQEPDKYVDAFVDAGADLVSIHVEATPHVHRVVEQIRNRGASAGIAVNPATPLQALVEVVSIVDLVLLMTVNPGFGGQTFIPETVEKIRRLRLLLEEAGSSHPLIEVDGGIKKETIRQAFDAGAEIFVCGSSVYNDDQPVSEGVSALRAALS